MLCRESNREGLLGMYITVLDAFKGEIACTLRVRLHMSDWPGNAAPCPAIRECKLIGLGIA